jgi:hypothetical protein
MTPQGFPWINIPMFADVGETQVFVRRREELAVLYRGLVQAGNAVRGGRFGVHRKFVVHGGLGVGKSALILECLRMLRDAQSGQTALSPDFPAPEDPERWLILRISGKHVTGLDGVAASLRWTMTEGESGDGPDGDADAIYPRLALYEHVHRQVEHVAQRAMQLSPMHHMLRTREVQLYDKVRADLRGLAETIEQIVRQGRDSGPQTGTTKPSDAGDGQPLELEEAHSLVSALNRFFRGASAAGLPTILCFDDFDELAVTAGASPLRRARTLSLLLREFSQLAPTCLLISLRSEFMSETLLRQFRRVFLPPLTRAEAAELLARWAEAQEPPLPADATARLQELGDRFLRRFPPDEPVVVPFRFLQLVAWLANNFLIYQLDQADEARMLWRYFASKYSLETSRALRAVVALMPAEHMTLSASASPLDASPYQSLSPPDRQALVRAGLLRGAAAADPDDARLVLDPLIGYLAVALKSSDKPVT